MRLEEVVERLKELRGELQSRYKVKTLALFGSTVRKGSGRDVDVLVEFKEPVGLKFFELWDFLEETLGLPVDLLTFSAVKEREEFWKEIEGEVLVVWEEAGAPVKGHT